METLSTHPYSRALISAAQSLQKSLPPIVDGRVEASAGIEATVGGRRYRLGKTEFTLVEKLAAHRGTIAAIVAREALGATSYIVLADPQGPIALFVFGERLRDDAATMVDAFIEKGVDAVLLSGDRREPVHAVAAALGIEQALAHQTPESKRNWVADQQRAGHRVAMLGDGMNDAPVIAQADVSIALASGSTLAQARADLIVLSSRLADVQYAFAVARRAMKIVRQILKAFVAIIAVACLTTACTPADRTGEGYVNVEGGRIWYAKMGNGSSTPLIVVHGGPGSGSCGLRVWEALGDERVVVRYDQLGAGKADHQRPTPSPSTGQVDCRRCAALGLTTVHLYGRSWGDARAGHLGSNPRCCQCHFRVRCDHRGGGGCRCSSDPSTRTRRRSRSRSGGTTDSPEYRAAMDEYYERYVRRRPRLSLRGADCGSSGALVYGYMWGPSEFTSTGTLKTFDATRWLSMIKVPTLFLAGEFDEATPASTALLALFRAEFR
jgi:proline iminopeptidase